MQRKPTFSFEAMVTLSATERVLRFFGYDLKRANKMDFSAFTDAMVSLCREHQRDSDGIPDMETTIELFGTYRGSKVSLSPSELQRGVQSARRCREWLHHTFPEADPHPEMN